MRTRMLEKRMKKLDTADREIPLEDALLLIMQDKAPQRQVLNSGS